MPIAKRGTVLNASIMKQAKHSLCLTCENLTFCCLTTDKRFIWSCSDYQEETTFNEQSEKPKTNGHSTFSDADSKLQLV